MTGGVSSSGGQACTRSICGRSTKQLWFDQNIVLVLTAFQGDHEVESRLQYMMEQGCCTIAFFVIPSALALKDSWDPRVFVCTAFTFIASDVVGTWHKVIMTLYHQVDAFKPLHKTLASSAAT